MAKYKEYILILIIITFSFSKIPAYQLKSDVISSGGTKMVSSNYIAKGTLSQMTASSPWLASSNYKAIIGFWHPDYISSVHEEFSLPPQVVLINFLCQNLPNPVYGSSTINYSLAQKGYVLLEVFNAIGQRVITLVDEEQEPGFYKLVWDVRNTSRTCVPAGVYFFRLKTKNYEKTRKIVILR